MRRLSTLLLLMVFTIGSFSQVKKNIPQKYPSLLWEISGNGLSKPSYLFGTMHVSSKMVFHLSDSFYLGIKNADVVALETNPGNWQEDFSRYDMDGQGIYSQTLRNKGQFLAPTDYLTSTTLQFMPYEKFIESALYSSPSIVNNFLYRSGSESNGDFEEDTYLDLHIFQVGKKWGKKLCGVEDFDQSMQLMKEAYIDAAKEKRSRDKTDNYDDRYSYGKLEDAYRTGNLDLLDTINKVNSTSAAFDEKFLYRRNEIQAHSIDSILRTRAALFVGVGAAHLPGQRGVIELLRKAGYTLRPIKISERDSRHKEEIDNIRIPVQFRKETSDDGFFSVNMPGKLYSFNRTYGPVTQQQYADMINGSYYMVTRIQTNAGMLGHDQKTVSRKVDSLIYENVPGKLLSKTSITRNGYEGFDITNRTRRGDCQRYNIFITPFEVIIFKMSGNGDYVRNGKEADQFFGSIALNEYRDDWKKYSPATGGFAVVMPHQPVERNDGNWQYMAIDHQTGTLYEVIRTDIHNYEFAEEDSFDLNLMEESFSGSDFIDKSVSRKRVMIQGYPGMDVKYKCKDGSVARARYIIQGPHYYTVVAHGKTENPKWDQFLNSFSISSFIYPVPVSQKDTTIGFTVLSPVMLEKPQKLEMFPSELYRISGLQGDDSLEDKPVFKGKLVENDSTGEKIYVNFYKPSRYFYKKDSSASVKDTTHFKTAKQNWIYRSRKKFMLPGNIRVMDIVLGDPASSRILHAKTFTKDGGIIYSIQTEGDTLTRPSAFVENFFNSFMPTGSFETVNTRSKKTGVFFADFFSKDSSLHKRAVKNIDKLDFDSSDFTMLKKSIQSLSWKDKKYLEVKKEFIGQLSSVGTQDAADFLKDLYYAAGDTVELQYTALHTLLQQKNNYAYQVFKEIMLNDPPVLGLDDHASFKTNISSMIFNSGNWGNSFNSNDSDDDDDNGDYYSGSFMDDLTDSLQLTSGIIKDILPLMNIHDYEKPVLNLLQVLIDSNQIKPEDYQMYLPKFLLEAKQEAKKQMIAEKNKSIERALSEQEAKNPLKRNNDKGNSELSLYATLLLPFWDQNPAVPQLIQLLLKSTDNRLKYNTMLSMIHHQREVPDTLLTYFAKLDGYRYELYSDLKDMKKLQLFPAAYNQPVALAKSKLLKLNSFDAPDTLVFLKKLPFQYQDRKGSVYFFKYRKKDDPAWKLATVGIVPDDPKKFEFEAKEKKSDEIKYDFTKFLTVRVDNDQPLDEQMEKALKRLSYSKRNSAAEFYNDDDNMMNYSRTISIRD